ncbi:5-dehydro-4-deoxyglucarate dehydratase [Streptomyces sp. NPDC091272]|uniref:5-dehydro-4-deoxyglucarate dehydratase n=1 Tax=Streptomyces sp. NPDC091272 TaxID=3365981 RepID=UPI00380B17FE
MSRTTVPSPLMTLRQRKSDKLMALPRTELDGLLAFPLTPFTHDLALDLDAFAETVEGHVAAGAGALFVACGTGEFSALAADELSALLRRAREVVAGRVPVWVGAGGGAATARAGVAAAQEGGADGVLLLPPYLVSGPPSGLVDHVRYAVHDTGVPVVVYHRSNGAFTPGSAVSLLGIPSVVGLKDGVGDVELMTRIVSSVRGSEAPRAGDFLFFNGLPTAEVSARAYRAIGVGRYSSAVHCFAPEIAIRFHGALAAGDDEVVEALLTGFYLPLVALRDETPGFAVSLVKTAARLRGDRVGRVRPPLVEPTAEQTERLEEIVKDGYALLSALDGARR